MPRQSDRQRLLSEAPLAYLLLSLQEQIRSMIHDVNLVHDDYEATPTHPSTVLRDTELVVLPPSTSLVVLELLVCILATRYLGPRLYNIPKRSHPLLYLHSLCDARFRQELRMSPPAFGALVDLIAPHPVFTSKSNNHQASVEEQLALFLAKLGRYGNGASVGILARTFGVSEGSVSNYCKRCIVAILALEKATVVWPTAIDRKRIAGRVGQRFGFPGCVGFVDGTLFPVYSKPSINGEDYYTRKGFYGMAGMVVCDDQRRILHIDLGWPGSVHDARVWGNSSFKRNPAKYFTRGEYLLADSGYPTSDYIVSAYKRVRGFSLSRIHEKFNKRLAQCRFVNEHTIGILKSRFPSLRGMRVDLSTTAGASFMIFMIRCAVVLHNLLSGDADDDWDPSLHDFDESHELDDCTVASGGREPSYSLLRTALANAFSFDT